MRLSGSVKLRCAFGSGAGGGVRDGLSSLFARAACPRAAASAAALAFASASREALASRLLTSRACLMQVEAISAGTIVLAPAIRRAIGAAAEQLVQHGEEH